MPKNKYDELMEEAQRNMMLSMISNEPVITTQVLKNRDTVHGSRVIHFNMVDYNVDEIEIGFFPI